MRFWKVIVVVDVALLMGLGGGYLWWAREVRELRRELETTRRAAAERQASQRSWIVRGIVRSVLPQMGALNITHEPIPGLMQGMTMGFEAEDPRVLNGLTPGDAVRFTLQQKGERLFVVAIEKEVRE